MEKLQVAEPKLKPPLCLSVRRCLTLRQLEAKASWSQSSGGWSLKSSGLQMVVARFGQDIILHVSCWIHLTTRSQNTKRFNLRLGYHYRCLRKVRVLKPNGISTKYAYCILLSSYPMMSVRWISFPIVWWNLGLKNEVRLVYIFQLLVLNDKHVLCPGLGDLIGRRLSLALRNKEAWSTWLARRVLLKSPLHQTLLSIFCTCALGNFNWHRIQLLKPEPWTETYVDTALKFQYGYIYIYIPT